MNGGEGLQHKTRNNRTEKLHGGSEQESVRLWDLLPRLQRKSDLESSDKQYEVQEYYE